MSDYRLKYLILDTLDTPRKDGDGNVVEGKFDTKLYGFPSSVEKRGLFIPKDTPKDGLEFSKWLFRALVAELSSVMTNWPKTKNYMGDSGKNHQGLPDGWLENISKMVYSLEWISNSSSYSGGKEVGNDGMELNRKLSIVKF